ncbi:MAG: hypothetical protein EXR77_02525 [Myxococcales bacterium]|nr:hypothetical protein [Myxococcales bacterium]
MPVWERHQSRGFGLRRSLCLGLRRSLCLGLRRSLCLGLRRSLCLGLRRSLCLVLRGWLAAYCGGLWRRRDSNCLRSSPVRRRRWQRQPDGSACDDGQACTGQETCTTGQCGGGHPICGCKTDSDCAAKDDGNLCNGTLYCDLASQNGVCKPNFKTAVTCAPSTDPCAATACDPKTGACVVSPLSSSASQPLGCDDGSPCTANDQCQAGKCVSGKAICQCLADADCADDGNLCNGTQYCTKEAFPFVCKTNPATQVTCPTGLDTLCAKHVCIPSSGQCTVQLAADGSPCDDSDACSNADFCANGTCKAGLNVCPCTSKADCAAHEAGDFCNGTLYCDLAATLSGCKINPATVVKCPTGDDTACHSNSCNKTDGKCKISNSLVTISCDDNNLCTTGDHCQDGACMAGANTCKCTEDKECASFEDANLCNGTLYCSKAKLPFSCEINPSTVVQCGDGNDTVCATNACDPKAGTCKMVPTANGTLCDADDFACTTGDACKGGVCTAGPNQCKCEISADCGKQEDGNLCNGTLYCEKSAQPFVCNVNPATLTVCQTVDDTACLENLCVAASGKCQKTSVHQGQTCDGDGDVCTSGDSCNLGVCQIGPNTCQCTSDANCAKYEDGNLCNGTLHCDKSAAPFLCKLNPATVISCAADKNMLCIKNLCQAKTGQCVVGPLGDGSLCDDGDPCSVSDVCGQGQCAGSPICGCQDDGDCATFDDGNLCNGTMICDVKVLPHVCKPNPTPVVCPKPLVPCQQSACEAKSGLCFGQADLAQDGTACDDKDKCSTQSKCAAGTCVASQLVVCNDGVVCTLDSCTGGTCVYAPAAPTPCDDSNACAIFDTCGVGKCNGKIGTCTDKDPCTADSCSPTIGCVYAPIADGGACTDGNACTSKDACNTGLCKGVGSCDDANPCTADLCGSSACIHEPVTTKTACDDGNLCTESDGCQNGTCEGLIVQCECGALCDPAKGCSKPGMCNNANPCIDASCVADLGCVGEPKPSPCGAVEISTCKMGLCGDCKALGAVIASSGNDVVAHGMVWAGAHVFAVGELNPGPTSDAFVVRIDGGKTTQTLQVLGGPQNDDALLGVADIGSGKLLAVGWTTDKLNSKGKQAWLVGVDKSGVVVSNVAHGGPGDEGFAGAVVTATGALAFGYADATGWVADVKNGVMGLSTTQGEIGKSIEWQAAALGPAAAKVLYVAGLSVDGNGDSQPTVAAIDSATLQTKWSTVIGIPFATATAIVATSTGATVVGWQTTPAGAQSWLAKLDTDGAASAVVFETALGTRIYNAATTLADGSLVAVGGAEQPQVVSKSLTTCAWFVRWNQALSQPMASAAQQGVSGKQVVSAIAPYKTGFLALGTVAATGAKSQGWLVQLSATGVRACEY